MSSKDDIYSAPQIPNVPEWFLSGPHRPPNSQSGHREPDALYHTVGVICTRWEAIEESLHELYICLMLRANPRELNLGAINAAFSALASASARRDVIANLADTLFFLREIPIRKHIKRDLTAVARAAGLRNRVAHGTVRKLNGEYMLLPPAYNPVDILWRDDMWDKGMIRYKFNVDALTQVSQVLSAIRTSVIDTKTKISRNELCSLPEKPQ